MKLYIVSYPVTEVSNEKISHDAIAGVFRSEKVADIICRLSEPNAKKTIVDLDYISSSYISLAKDILGTDLVEMVEKESAGLSLMSDFDQECKMAAEEFDDYHNSGGILPCDGSGYWATDTMVSNISCFEDKPKWATHVCWFNK